MTNIEQQGRDIFLAALDRAPELWPAWLDEACGDNSVLRARVEELLQGHQALGSIHVGAPAVEATAESRMASELAGSIVGGFKLLEQIGEGGFGVVYMAEQSAPVRRKVALKILKPGMDTRQVVARFEGERQALAIMDHPNIAKIISGGATPTGRPYFVMELVRGVPITQYCDEKKLTPRERLELFIPVCQAVQHAHQKGIIHRDLKPSNVLVTVHDTTPVPKVIDFGIAKALGQELTDKTLFTGFAQMIGTPLYMSPEQAGLSGLDIDTRGDIYSLGVLLYELLTGTTPFSQERFKQAAYDEIRRIIREEEPPKPSTRLSDSKDSLPSISAQRQTEPAKLTKLVRGELDWIVMKALEKDRSRRYETANGFAADVQRYLADEPVQACPPSTWYRLQKFMRRNKRAFATSVVMSLAILVAVGALGWAVRDREARAERDLVLTEQGLGQAVEKVAQMRAELHAMLIKPGGVQELLNQPGRWSYLIQSAQSELAQGRRLAARAENRLSAELAQALDKLDEQLRGDEADRLLALRLEKIRLDRATWVKDGFDFRRAAVEYSQVFADFAVLKEDAATVAVRLRSSPIKEQLVAGLDDWARTVFVLRDQPTADLLLALARQAAPDPAWGNRLRDSKVWRDQAATIKLVEDAPVTQLPPQTLSLIGVMLPANSSRRESWLRRSQTQYPADFWLNYDLANEILETQPLEAAGFFRAALVVRPTSNAAHASLGNALQAQKRFPEAAIAFRKAIEIDPKFAPAYVNLGNAFGAQKQFPEAIAAFRKAIEIEPSLAAAHNNLGGALKDSKQFSEAVAAFHKAIEIDPNYVPAHYNLGLTMENQKKLDEAIAAFGRAIEIDPKYAAAYNSLGNVLSEQKKLDEAIAAYRKAIQFAPKDAKAYNNLGNALSDQKKPVEAIAFYRKAIELDPNDAAAYYNLGSSLSEQNKLDEAIAAYRKTIELDPNFAKSYHNLGLALRSQKKLDEAIAASRKAIELDPNHAPAYDNLGLALSGQNKLDEAIAAYRKAVEIDPKMAPTRHRLGAALRTQGKLDEAIAEFRQAFSLESNTSNRISLADLLTERAWHLATDNEPKARDPGQAIDLAKEAAELVPTDAGCWKTLGVAHYRAGNWKDAIAALEKSPRLNPHYRKESVVLFFLSMAHAQLNQKEQSRTFYDQAVQWRMGISATDEELRRLCADAAALMGLEVPPTLQEPPVLPPGPALVKPAARVQLDNGSFDRAKSRAWEFDWSDVPGATQYHLYLIGPTAKVPAINNPTLSSSSYRHEATGHVTDPNRMGWRWKVRALVNGNWTDWSEERTFDVAPFDGNKPALPKY